MTLMMPEISNSGPMGLVVGIDASRNRSGGAKAHLIGLIAQGYPLEHGISQVHLWAYKTLLDSVPDQPWLVKHNPPALEKSLVYQVLWQVFSLPGEVREVGCDIMLNTDAGTLASVSPSVTMSRDMLSYEPGEIERYGWSKARLRLILLRYIQNRSLRRSDGAVFLTKYAAKVIQQSCGTLSRVGFIPHGVGQNFQEITRTLPWPANGVRPIRLLYISNAALYKHQWMVIRAVEQLRNAGVDVILTLVGGGSGPAQKMLRHQMALSDPRGEFVTQEEFVPQADLPDYLAEADIFVFASSCENMPNTLVEAMAAGLPIACSLRGPMPEVLEDGGEYFDPEVSESIAYALRRLIEDENLRRKLAARAKTLSTRYSWDRCARETWSFLAETYKHINS
jgi:glycosyltransferase involved in cell wall biosynthesis